jgi:hypothetical protein
MAFTTSTQIEQHTSKTALTTITLSNRLSTTATIPAAIIITTTTATAPATPTTITITTTLLPPPFAEDTDDIPTVYLYEGEQCS